MARPKDKYPTTGELEILKILWTDGACTVRDVMEKLKPRRAYTSVMSRMNIMYDKGLLSRKPHGRAFIYKAKVGQDRTLGGMVGDLLGRAFEGSASGLVAHLLDHSNPSEDELREIRRTIEEHLKKEAE